MDELTSKMSALKIKNAPTIIYLGSSECGLYEVVIPAKRVRIKTKAELSGWAGSPKKDEVEEAVRQWYADRGQEVPVADLEMCRQMREAEEAAEVAVEKAAATEQKSSIADVKPESVLFYKRIGARARSPVINQNDLDEVDLRSMIKGGIIGAGVVMVAGGLLWWSARGEKVI